MRFASRVFAAAWLVAISAGCAQVTSQPKTPARHAMSALALAVSPDCTTNPPVSPIVDAQLASWTFAADGSSNIYRDGVYAQGYGSIILWAGGTIYHLGSDGQTWYKWIGAPTYWQGVGSTRPICISTSIPVSSITDPANVEFTPSVDQDALNPDGTPKLTSYTLAAYLAGGSSQVGPVVDIGKPAPQGDGKIRLPIPPTIKAALVPATVYEMHALANGPGGASSVALSNLFDFSLVPPPPSAPAAPTNLRVTGASSTTIALAWDDTANETAYSLQQNGVDVLSLGANVTVATASGLMSATAYTFQVRASNDVGSSLSNSLTASTASDSDTTAPSVSIVSIRHNGNSKNYVVTATASDAAGVIKVVFMLDGRIMSTQQQANPVPSGTYSATLSVSAAGSHTVLVQATDQANNTGQASQTFVR